MQREDFSVDWFLLSSAWPTTLVSLETGVTRNGLGVLHLLQECFRSFAECCVSLPYKGMAASSAAFNIEVITYDILNSFSLACTTFVGQNFGAGELRRCKRTMALCLIEGVIVLAIAISTILFFGKSLLAVFNSDPDVIETGYIRLMTVMLSHSFSLFYDVMSGYMRGFGISFVPALLTMVGVCGVRIGWIRFVFPQSRNFQTIMNVYPVSLSITMLLIFIALLCYRPSKRFASVQSPKE